MNTATLDPGSRAVMPASGRIESLLFATALIALVTATIGYVLLKPQAAGPPPLLSWQVSSFDGLGAADQAIHSALLPAAEEIVWTNNDTGTWPTVTDLEEALLPPFYQDNFWKTNGEVRWQVVMPGANSTSPVPPSQPATSPDPAAPLDFAAIANEAQGQLPPAPNAVYKGTQGQGTASYYGSGGKLPGQSAYLVVIGHAHTGVYWTNQATLWIHKDPDAPFPDILKPDGLVTRGWRQIVPYNGTSEVERVKGKDNG